MTIESIEVQRTSVLERGLETFVFKVDELRGEGWEFDPQSPPCFYGYSYECKMLRYPTKLHKERDKIVAATPTRAEVLAHAREVKAAKRAAALQEEAKNGNTGDQ